MQGMIVAIHPGLATGNSTVSLYTAPYSVISPRPSQDVRFGRAW
jgi:hypothetical protein